MQRTAFTVFAETPGAGAAQALLDAAPPAAKALDDYRATEAAARADFNSAHAELARARATRNASRLAAITAAIAASTSAEVTAILRRAEALIRAANDFDARIDTLKHSTAQFDSQTFNLTHRIALAQAHVDRDRRALDHAQTRTAHLKTQAAHLRARAKALSR